MKTPYQIIDLIYNELELIERNPFTAASGPCEINNLFAELAKSTPQKYKDNEIFIKVKINAMMARKESRIKHF